MDEEGGGDVLHESVFPGDRQSGCIPASGVQKKSGSACPSLEYRSLSRVKGCSGVILPLFLLMLLIPAAAQTQGAAAPQNHVNAQQQGVGLPASTIPAAPGASSPTAEAAMRLYRQGRDLEYQGKIQAAQTAYAQAVAKSEQLLLLSSKDMDAHVVRAFSLFRLGKYQEVATYGREAMKSGFDPRLAEILGEAAYMLGKNEESIQFMAQYIAAAGEKAELVPNAYYYTAESYMRLKKFAHADIAFSAAVALAPSMPRWWYRLGVACEEQGQFRRAYESYQKSLSLNPRTEEVTVARDRVKTKAGM